MTTAAKGPSRARLIIPFVLVGLALAGVAVWWLLVASRIAAETDRVAADLRRAGYNVSWSDRRIGGFPFRTQVTFTDFRFLTRDGHGIEAPRLGAAAETLALGKWVVVASEGLVLHRGAKGQVGIKGSALRASISHLTATPALFSLVLKDPVFTDLRGEPFPLASAGSVELYLRPDAARAGDGDLLFVVKRGRPRPGGVLDWIAGGSPIDSQWALRLAALEHFQGRDWGSAVRGWTSRGGAVTGLKAEVSGGDAAALVTGDRLVVGPDGRLRGAVKLELSEGAAALAALTHAPAIAPEAARAASADASRQSAPDGHQRFDLVFDDQGSRLGRLRLAKAPKVW